MGNAAVCPHCGAGPSQSVVGKGVDSVAKATGTVLEKGVEITDKVVKGAAPVVKTIFQEGKRGVRQAREETLKVARKMKEESK